MFSWLITHKNMDAECDSQIRSNHNHHRGTHRNASFSGPACQMGAGAGGLAAFAMRMGRLAIPFVRRYVLPVPKQPGRNLLEAALPEIAQLLAGKKRLSGKMLKNALETATKKTIKTSAPRFAGRSVGATVARQRAARSGGGRMVREGMAAADRQYKSKATEHFNSILARIDNDTNHFQIKSRQENSVRYSIWNSVCLIVKPHRQQGKRASNLALPTAAKTTTFSGSAMEIEIRVTHCALEFFEKRNVLINYEGSYDHEDFPYVGCCGASWTFLLQVKQKKLDWLESYSVECKSWSLHGGREDPHQSQWSSISFFEQHGSQNVLRRWIVFGR